MLEPGYNSSGETIVRFSGILEAVVTLKLAGMGIFTPQKPTNATNQGSLIFPPREPTASYQQNTGRKRCFSNFVFTFEI